VNKKTVSIIVGAGLGLLGATALARKLARKLAKEKIEEMKDQRGSDLE